MFLASNICWVSSGTIRAQYCWLPWLVSQVVKLGMKKCRWGKGIMLMASIELARKVQAGGDPTHGD